MTYPELIEEINNIDPNIMNADIVCHYIFNDYVMDHETTFDRRRARWSLVFHLNNNGLLESHECQQPIVLHNPENIEMISNPHHDLLLHALEREPRLAALPQNKLDTSAVTIDEWQMLADKHQYIYNLRKGLGLSKHPDHVDPIKSKHSMMQVPDYMLAMELGYGDHHSMQRGDHALLKKHPLKHKDPIKVLHNKYREFGFDEDDMLDNDQNFGFLLNSIHHCRITHSKRLTYNDNNQLFNDDEYHYYIFSINADDAIQKYGRDIVDSIRSYYNHLTPLRCKYDYGNIVLGWCRFVEIDGKIFIDEIQSDIKRPLKDSGLVDNATLNKIEYHILVQSIKHLYDKGFRDVCMPTWKQRSELYKQAPGTSVPKDPYSYIPRRVGFIQKSVAGIHKSLDNEQISYLNLRITQNDASKC